MMKKFLTSLVLAVVIAGSAGSFAGGGARSGDVANVARWASVAVGANVANAGIIEGVKSGKLNVGACVQSMIKGDFDFFAFMNSLIFNEKFLNEMYAPWYDVIYTTQCQALDILNVVNEENSIRKELRKKFLSCDTEGLPRLINAYHEVLAELYYVRHVIHGEANFELPFFSKKLSGGAGLINEDIYDEMYDKYVVDSEYFDEEDFDPFYNDLAAKYSARVPTYIACPNTSWQEVVDKWEEFKKELYGGFGAVDAFEETKKRATEGIAGAAKDLYRSVTTEKGFIGYVDSIVDIAINNEDIPLLETGEGFAQLYETLKEAAGLGYEEYNSSGVTQGDLFGAYTNLDRNYDISELRATMLAQFYANYGKSSVELEDFMEQLNRLDAAITRTYTPLEQIVDATKTMNKRQCP